ncbi:MAG TPA: aminoglycoside phosphotransferase family protein [Aridibacter sp.]|nr:aminoglycoside phosphotransferase family protein [Aridibacter sp.]
MNLIPEDLKQSINRLGGGRGSRWLDSLPAVIRDLEELWSIRQVVPLEKQSYSFTSICTLVDGSPGFLKIGFPSEEEVIAKEAAILRLYGEDLAPKVYGHDPDREALLLERLDPGTTLFLECRSDPTRAVREAIEVLRRIPRALPDGIEIPALEEWFTIYEARTSQIVPEDVLGNARRLLQDLELGGDVLLHGDFHHGNILSAGEGFKVIDPKGARGAMAYEAAVFLNEHNRLYFKRPDACEQILHTVDAFADELGLSKEHMLGWALCQSVQCMCWDAEDFGEYNEIDLSVASRWLEMIGQH